MPGERDEAIDRVLGRRHGSGERRHADVEAGEARDFDVARDVVDLR